MRVSCGVIIGFQKERARIQKDLQDFWVAVKELKLSYRNGNT